MPLSKAKQAEWMREYRKKLKQGSVIPKSESVIPNCPIMRNSSSPACFKEFPETTMNTKLLTRSAVPLDFDYSASQPYLGDLMVTACVNPSAVLLCPPFNLWTTTKTTIPTQTTPKRQDEEETTSHNGQYKISF